MEHIGRHVSWQLAGVLVEVWDIGVDTSLAALSGQDLCVTFQHISIKMTTGRNNNVESASDVFCNFWSCLSISSKMVR